MTSCLLLEDTQICWSQLPLWENFHVYPCQCSKHLEVGQPAALLSKEYKDITNKQISLAFDICSSCDGIVASVPACSPH